MEYQKHTEMWNKTIIIPLHKKGDKLNCNNYRGILLLNTIYNILLDKIQSFVDKCTGSTDVKFKKKNQP